MSAKAIREYDGKYLLSKWLNEYSEGKHTFENKCIQITPIVFDTRHPEITFDSIELENPWLLNTKLVVKPDQLIKRRGKSNLILLNATWKNVKQWITERMNHEIKIENVKGIIDHFLIEPFIPHTSKDEYYCCIQSNRNGEEILFYHEGGINIGNIDEKAYKLQIPIDEIIINDKKIKDTLLISFINDIYKQNILSSFIVSLLKLYRELNFVYLEMNPLIIIPNTNKIIPLDIAAKLDETANFICGQKWGNQITFPPAFGRAKFPEESFIQDLDSKTGASLKLTILNHLGRIWTMVAGGGASVVYADTISDLGYGHELANYGEYSGAPSESQTYEYARTIIELMTRQYNNKGKILIIGGGIANFTDVAMTFTGIIRAIKYYQDKLRTNKVHIWVRRGGPNYQEGLKLMKQVGKDINVPIEVYGPETHITAIVPMALGLVKKKKEFENYINSNNSNNNSNNNDVEKPSNEESNNKRRKVINDNETNGVHINKDDNEMNTNIKTSSNLKNENNVQKDITILQDNGIIRMTNSTRCIVYGLQQRAVQGMLDFDYLCKREKPSVAALIFPFSGNHYLKFYWGTNERLIPVFQDIKEAVTKFPDVSLFINFSSFRSVYSTTMDAFKYNNILKTHAIIAEGVPESQTRFIINEAKKRNVGIIGPATVGGIKPGCIRIGNTGGMLDNIIYSKLYRPGSVAYVSKSGGMSNELNNIISQYSDGVYEGVAIGGDRYPGSTFLDHVLRYESNPDIKMMVLLGEVGGKDEYLVCNAIKNKKIKKPVVAWCIGTCAKIFPYEVQFGHAGACATGELETACAKNEALKSSGAIVPKNFDDFGLCIKEQFDLLVKNKIISLKPEPPVPQMPMDYAWAKNLGLIRKPANFISSISDDRGGELKYAGMPISEIFSEDLGIGGVLGLLWFKRKLPSYASKFIEMVLMVTADHGPAVSGAHNTIVTARAGKDLISSIVSGLLTIGPRFGGALDAAAEMFSNACDSGLNPEEFVKKMRSENKLIMGIGHRIKSLTNPDMRVQIIREYAIKYFPSIPILKYALEVEKITTKKKSNLILNVDGCIAVCFVDLLRNCGAFTKNEADEHLANGCLNGLFVLGRSIGFIGHFLDQKRLKQPLYRHPWDDISYMSDSI